MLLGIPGDNTYSNYQEANRALYRQTVLPLAERIFGALIQWLSPLFGGGLRLCPDLDQISALAPERESLWRRVNEASFLTDDEKRIAVGYGPRPVELKFNPEQPRDEIGRWTDVGGGNESLSNQSIFAQVANVIRICISMGVSRATDSFGNKTFTVTYLCAGNRTITLYGLGHNPQGFIIDPRQ